MIGGVMKGKELIVGLDPNQLGAYGVVFGEGDRRVYPFRLSQQPQQPGDYHPDYLVRLLRRTRVVGIEVIDHLYDRPHNREYHRQMLQEAQRVAHWLATLCEEAGVEVRRYPGRWPVRVGREEIRKGEGAWMQLLLHRPWVSKGYLEKSLRKQFRPMLPMTEHHWDALGLAALAQREIERHR
jgi:hypothetical protein